MQLLMEAGIIKKNWYKKGREIGNIKEEHIVQYNNKLKDYYKSVNTNNICYEERKKSRDTVSCKTYKFNPMNGYDGREIKQVSITTFELVTEARIVVDMMHVLVIKLMELDDNSSRVEYLTNVIESPSTWEEGYTSQARVSAISKYNNTYRSGFRFMWCHNFSSDRDIETAYSNEMKARDIPSNEPSIFNSEQNDILVKQAVQVFMDKLAPPTRDELKTREEAIIEAIKSETFDGIVISNSPFKQLRDRQHETTLLCMLTSDEINKVRGDIKLVLGQFRPSCYTNEDVQSASGNKSSFQPLEYQPCFECILCQQKMPYNSTSEVKDKIIKTRRQNNELQINLIPHLLSCDKFKEKETEYKLLGKEMEQYKGKPTGFTNEMAIKLSRLDGIGGIVPIVYNHQERIAKARQTYDLAEKKFGKVNPKHVPLYKIFSNPKIEKLINYIICHDGITKNVNYDLYSLAGIFKRLGGVNIYDFRTPDEWKSIFVNKSASVVLHQMYIFTLRVRQEECAQGEPGDYPVEKKRFGGAITHQSNHIEADGEPPESDEAKTKNFDLAVKNAGKPIIEITDEASKTMLTSVEMHNVGWSWYKPNRAMPDTLYSSKPYPDVKKVVPFYVVQDSKKGRRVHALIDRLAANIDNDNADDAVYVTTCVEEATGYNRMDLADFENKEYDDAFPSEKINFLKMIEYYFERREAGGCFMSCCDKRFRNRPRKDFCWFDGHHASSDSKEDEPSKYRNMSVEKARLERRRCVPLCRPCHMEVHHTPGKDNEFMTELKNEHTVGGDGQIEKKKNGIVE